MRISWSFGALCTMLWVLEVGVNEISSRNKLVLSFSNYLISQFKSNCSQAETAFLARQQGLGEQSSGKSVLLTAIWECTLPRSYPLPFLSCLILSLWLYLSTYWCQLLSGSPEDLNSNHMSDLLDSEERGLRTVLLIARRMRRLPSKPHDIQIEMGAGNGIGGRITREGIHLPGKKNFRRTWPWLWLQRSTFTTSCT